MYAWMCPVSSDLVPIGHFHLEVSEPSPAREVSLLTVLEVHTDSSHVAFVPAVLSLGIPFLVPPHPPLGLSSRSASTRKHSLPD
jgi:hypothetical protein